MLDAVLARLIGPALEAVARRLGSGATALALVAFVLSLAAVPLIALHQYLIALPVFIAARITAAIASRGTGAEALAPVLDGVAFAALPFGFALADPSRALAGVFVMFGLAAQSASALRFGKGIISDTELCIAFAVACIFPDRFSLVAYVVGVLCFVSAGVRIAGRSS